VVLTALTVTVACSSNSASSTSGAASTGTASSTSGGAPSPTSAASDANAASAPGITSSTIKIGLLTSFTGPLAATFATVPTGFEARIALQNAEGGVDGRKIQVAQGDDQGSASQALAAAKTLVEQDNVFAIGGLGTYQFAASPYLEQQNIPVVGYSIDGGPEWAAPYTNTVAVLGSPNPKYPAAVAWGTFLKSHGATSVAAVGAAAPSAQVIAKNILAAAKAAGLKTPYLNVTIPLAQTAGFDPVVQAIKASGADAVTMAQGTAADLGLLAAIQQAGLKLKVLLVLPAVPSASINNAQVKTEIANTWSAWPVLPPIAKNATSATITDALAKYEHQTTQPDQDELAAWASADAIIKGLQAAGQNPTRATFMANLKAMTNYDGGGTALSPTNIAAAFGAGAQDAGPAPGDCLAFTQYVGDAFQNPSTVCGGLVPNSDAG